MATTYLSRTQDTGSTDAAKKFTVSLWIKRGGLGVSQVMWSSGSGVSAGLDLYFDTNNNLCFEALDGATNPKIISDREFRDPGAWMHIVAAIDTPQATPADTVKLYVNGVQETSFSTSTYPAQDYEFSIGTTSDTMKVGTGTMAGATNYWNGNMAHLHYTDGQVYAASNFGSTDATSGIWIPNSAPSVTYGNNGLFLKFASGAFGTDSSGNANTMTVTGTMTNTKDNAMDNYCTWNSVGNVRISGGTAYPVTFSNSNTTALNAHATYHTGCMGTMGVKKGKWYYECKCSDVGGIDYIGYAGEDDWGNLLNTYTYANDGTIDDVAYGNTYTSGDIISVAFDADNGTIWFGKNGVWQNSASEAEIEAGTDTNAAVTSMDMTKYYLLAQKGFQDATNQLNTGNGYFGTTAITSAGTNAGEGLFEYDVPSGYYAFNTNNLATYG